MLEFNPPISERGTEALIAIAYSSTDVWQQAAIDQANAEFRKQAVSEGFIQKKLNDRKEEEAHLEAAYQQQLEANAIEGYSIPMMLYIVLASPLILIGKWTVDLSLFEIKEHHYQRKFRQRLLLLLGGLVFWFTVIALEIN